MSSTTIRYSGVPENSHSRDSAGSLNTDSAAYTGPTSVPSPAASTGPAPTPTDPASPHHEPDHLRHKPGDDWVIDWNRPYDVLDPGPFGSPGWFPDRRTGRHRRDELPDPITWSEIEEDPEKAAWADDAEALYERRTRITRAREAAEAAELARLAKLAGLRRPVGATGTVGSAGTAGATGTVRAAGAVGAVDAVNAVEAADAADVPGTTDTTRLAAVSRGSMAGGTAESVEASEDGGSRERSRGRRDDRRPPEPPSASGRPTPGPRKESRFWPEVGRPSPGGPETPHRFDKLREDAWVRFLDKSTDLAAAHRTKADTASEARTPSRFGRSLRRISWLLRKTTRPTAAPAPAGPPAIPLPRKGDDRPGPVPDSRRERVDRTDHAVRTSRFAQAIRGAQRARGAGSNASAPIIDFAGGAAWA
ncbi:hypothetical protein [Glycomyces sp. NRRL B-16210]|uniref:hypothetical protein n=1 Tax=Glycomyces sp. NRRL B-16210 TaxID=1463821 RepID=UPI0004BFB53F|nr:hypothetical protein [Glycomyces sp. NRRL B-16210]